MSDAGIIAFVGASVLAVIGAAAGAWFSSYNKRRDDKDKSNGERMGRIEAALDYERGRQAGLREAREEARRGSRDQ